MDDAEFRRSHRRALVEDRISGASQLARQALDSLAEYAGSCAERDPSNLRRTLIDFAEQLQYARPSMAPIYNMLQRWIDRVDGLSAHDTGTLRHEAASFAQALADQSLQAVEQAARRAAELIGGNVTIITHSLSSTVTETFRQLSSRDVKAIVTEGRPGFEGRQQALHLDQAGIPVTLITDAQMGHFVQRADLVLVGADTLLSDGSVVNKVGTSLLALAAREHDVPFHVCCESFKEIPFSAKTVELEEADPAEIDAPRGRSITPCNLYFDITPAKFVSAWITDERVRKRRTRSPKSSNR